MLKYEQVKILLEMATTVERVEQIMSKYTSFETVKEKIDFLKDMFSGLGSVCEGLGDDSNEEIYQMLLHRIVKTKFD